LTVKSSYVAYRIPTPGIFRNFIPSLFELEYLVARVFLKNGATTLSLTIKMQHIAMSVGIKRIMLICVMLSVAAPKKPRKKFCEYHPLRIRSFHNFEKEMKIE
jgi:hypothetical protein